MLLLRLLQQLVRTLTSEGTPGQVAAGVALGAALGLTPLLSLHNLVLLGLALLLQVSLPAFFLGWTLFVPVGFLLDPLSDRVGSWLLLETPGLQPLWTAWYNTPFLPLTGFNNTIGLGSLVLWVLLLIPLFLLVRFGVARYRATLHARLVQTRFYRAVRTSRLYTFYRLLHPGS